MSEPKMKWGETPWDDWSRDDMLRELQRMYSAIISTRSALRVLQVGSERSPFWGAGGTGGRALSKADQIEERYHERGEDIYRAFFRYADDLLFNGLGSGWMVCERGHMLGRQLDGASPLLCLLCKSTGLEPTPMRPLTWDDLRRE